jgi:hypothetical protein
MQCNAIQWNAMQNQAKHDIADILIPITTINRTLEHIPECHILICNVAHRIQQFQKQAPHTFTICSPELNHSHLKLKPLKNSSPVRQLSQSVKWLIHPPVHSKLLKG